MSAKHRREALAVRALRLRLRAEQLRGSAVAFLVGLAGEHFLACDRLPLVHERALQHLAHEWFVGRDRTVEPLRETAQCRTPRHGGALTSA